MTMTETASPITRVRPRGPSLGLLTPDLYYRSVLSIDFDELRARGVRALLLDLDNTLLPRDTGVVAEEYSRWVAHAREQGFDVCIVSNNWHAHVEHIAAELGCGISAKALKPLPHAFRRAMAGLKVEAREVAVIGDQVFTDVLGGNMLGATTVLVEPLSRTDLPHTLLLRLIERHVLADREPLA